MATLTQRGSHAARRHAANPASAASTSASVARAPSFSPPVSGASDLTSGSSSSSSSSSLSSSLLGGALQPGAMGILLGQGWHVYNEGWAKWTAGGLAVSSIAIAVGLALGVLAGRRRVELRSQCFWLACLVTGGLAAIAQLRLRLGQQQGGALAVNGYLSSLVLGTSLPHVAMYLTSDLRPGKLLPCALMMLMTEAICANEAVPLLQMTTFLALTLGGLLGLAAGGSGSAGGAGLLEGLGQVLGSSDDPSSQRRKKAGSKASGPGSLPKGGKAARHSEPLEPFNPTTSTSKKRYAPKFLLSHRAATLELSPPRSLETLALSVRLGEVRKRDRDRRPAPNPGIPKEAVADDPVVEEDLDSDPAPKTIVEDRGADSTQVSPEKVVRSQADETDQDQTDLPEVGGISEAKPGHSALSTSLRATAEEFVPPATPAQPMAGAAGEALPVPRSGLRADAVAFQPVASDCSPEILFSTGAYHTDTILGSGEDGHAGSAGFGDWHGSGGGCDTQGGEGYPQHLGVEPFQGSYREQGEWDSYGDYSHYYDQMAWTDEATGTYGYEGVPDVPSPSFDVSQPPSNGSLPHRGSGRPVQSDITLRSARRKKQGEEVSSLVPANSGPEGSGRASELRGRQNEDSTPMSRTLLVSGFGTSRKFNEDDVAGLFGAEASVANVNMIYNHEEKGCREAFVEFASKAAAQEALDGFPTAASICEEERAALSVAFAGTSGSLPVHTRSSSSLPSQSGSLGGGGGGGGGGRAGTERKQPTATPGASDAPSRRRRESQGNRSGPADEKCCWAYIDPNGEVQTGFTSQEMRQWADMGYFKSTQRCALIWSSSKTAEAPPLSEFYPLDEWFPQRNKRFAYIPSF